MLIFAIIGCLDMNDYRADWSLHTPTFDSAGVQREQLVWRVESAPGHELGALALERGLKLAEPEWENALSCGTKIKQASTEEEADVVFRCKNLGESGAWEENYHMRIEDDGNVRRIDIESDWCETSGHQFYTYVMGRALGMARTSLSYCSVMNGFSLTKWFKTDDAGICDMERDGLRIWSLQHGAPGCGAEDPQWSWEKYPDLYKSYPDDEELEQLLLKD
jgi:hypothetical protein